MRISFNLGAILANFLLLLLLHLQYHIILLHYQPTAIPHLRLKPQLPITTTNLPIAVYLDLQFLVSTTSFFLSFLLSYSLLLPSCSYHLLFNIQSHPIGNLVVLLARGRTRYPRSLPSMPQQFILLE